ncbi:Feruloyl CoA ortho-hydroxylase 2 [Capsicum baccatum]|uniref:Feruloyl CoA ortho-hydroxylase 2 n=1 Tax=Capsicum baccatum TaxID=33114 RepID=A0A2G2XPS3_CAPBA|nr:Feruloyl CoA ortho-hydroxylase 2 [Capsicum baccatum]
MADESRFSVAGSTDCVLDNSNDNSVDTIDAKKRKEMESRSTVWEHFEKIFENDKLVKATCLHFKERCLKCGLILNCHPKTCGALSLRKHLEKCYMKIPIRWAIFSMIRHYVELALRHLAELELYARDVISGGALWELIRISGDCSRDGIRSLGIEPTLILEMCLHNVREPVPKRKLFSVLYKGSASNEGHGVKGLADMGIQTLPKQYIQPLRERITSCDLVAEDQSIPVIDLSNWNNPKDATHRFFALPAEKKKDPKNYSCTNVNVRFGTSFTSQPERALEWKDYLRLFMFLIKNHLHFGLLLAGSDTRLPVPPISVALLINIGDALQILSNGRYRSIKHRVIANEDNSRVSVPIFVNLKTNDVIGPLQEVLENGEKQCISKFFTRTTSSISSRRLMMGRT